MSDSTIGIKLANGTYYPILKEGEVSKKKLVLTTVKDNQESVQIDLYKGTGEQIEDAAYIGSLVIEDIESAESGEPDIDLVIGIDEEGNLHATANDEATGDSQSLSVGIQTLDGQGVYEVPEFDLDFDEQQSMTPEEEEGLTGDETPPPYEGDDMTRFAGDESSDEDVMPAEEQTGPAKIALFSVLGLIVLGLVALLLFRMCSGPDVPPLQAQDQQNIEEAEDSGSAAAESDAPDTRDESVAMAGEEPSAAGEVPSAEEQEPSAEQEASVEEEPSTEERTPTETEMKSIKGVWYRIKRGDTLWDLSSSFYENPWLFPELADENDIPNPDLIYEGRDLYIPNPRQ